MDTQLVVTIITSAAVGALASSLVSLLGQFLERRARRQELLLSKAIELAFQRIDFVLQAADRAGKKVRLRSAVSLAAKYYQGLQHLLSKGDLPPDAQAEEEASEKKLQGDASLAGDR